MVFMVELLIGLMATFKAAIVSATVIWYDMAQPTIWRLYRSKMAAK
jgi:hypothetical protein